ncbi:hypothetical protein ACOSQ4_020528 [Xanthoceras sorbifolium]
MHSNFQSDGYKNTGCYNIQCLGFVQIDRSFAFGGDVKPVSIYNESLSEIQFVIKKDKESGNWWLALVDKILGYWPGALFPGLADHSTAIIMGGAVLNKKIAEDNKGFDGTHFYNGGPGFSIDCL